MANLKLHTIGIHGGFHHNFLYTVVRTVACLARVVSDKNVISSAQDVALTLLESLNDVILRQ